MAAATRARHEAPLDTTGTGQQSHNESSTPRTALRSSGQRLTNGLVALSSAVVLTIYTAGYLKTQAAADRYAAESERRPGAPLQRTALAGGAEPAVPLPTSAPSEGLSAAGTAAAGPATPAPVAAPAAPRSAEDEKRPASTTAVAPKAPSQPATVPALAPATKPAAAAAPAVTTTAESPSGTTPVAVAVATAVDGSPAPATSVTTPAEPPAAAAPAAYVAPKYKDGTYQGWGTSRHGDVQAEVIIAAGRITSARISQCDTRWPCSWISPLPPQVVARQSAETDFVSGATQSTNAFYYAVVEALGKAAVK